MPKIFKEISKLLIKEGFFCFTFEEYVSGDNIQGKKESALGEGLVEKVPKLLSFKVYRRTFKEIEKLLKESGFKVLLTKKFVGYFKTKKKIPVHYVLILAQK